LPHIWLHKSFFKAFLLLKVGIVSETGAAIITSSSLQDEIEGSESSNLTETQVSRHHPDSFHIGTSMVIASHVCCPICVLIINITYLGK